MNISSKLEKNIRLTKKKLTFVRAVIKGLSEEKKLSRKRKYDNSDKHFLRSELRTWHAVYAFLLGKPFSSLQKKKPEAGPLSVLSAQMFIKLKILHEMPDYHWAIPFKQMNYRNRELLTIDSIFEWLKNDTQFFLQPEPENNVKREEKTI